MNLPYGMADFPLLRQEDYFYVDKTHFIPALEDASRGRRHLLFLRPRRFGKSLLLSMLEAYYDVARKPDFEALFTGLYIGATPTATRNSFLVLRLDFAGITSDMSEDDIRRSFNSHVVGRLNGLVDWYRTLAPELKAAWDEVDLSRAAAADMMDRFLSITRRTPWPLYVMIDEYDSFANDLIARGRSGLYRQILGASGFVRQFFKRLKTAADTGTIRRMFITGVSPLMVNDMTSGFNILNSISQLDEFHELCGFRQQDVDVLLDGVTRDRGLTIDRAQVLDDLRRYYDGYRFSPGASAPLYNPDMVLYFMTRIEPPARYPAQLLDMNVRTDYSRLHRLLFDEQERPRKKPFEQLQELLTQGEIQAPLHDLFRLEEVYDERFFASYLYYLGLVTLAGQSESLTRLKVPNAVIEMTYGEALHLILRTAGEVEIEEDVLAAAVGAMAFRGTVAPFCDLLFTQVISKLSNRDLIRMDEKALKVLVLGYLGLVDVYHPFSELEIGRGYSDLVLVVSRRYEQARFSWIVELKYIKETEAPAPGKKKATRKTAAKLRREIAAAFAAAEEQIHQYQGDARLVGLSPEWRSVTLVQVGTEALYHRQPGQATQRAAGDDLPLTQHDRDSD